MRLLHLLATCLLASSTQAVSAQADLAVHVAQAAQRQVGVTRHYDPKYVRLAYPGGDVATDRGVCSDVVIRAYRAAHVDFQQLLHEDMRSGFAMYPRLWGLRRPDSNIDHRRVANLQRFFERQDRGVPISNRPDAYRAGDIVSWRLPNGLAHIGIVSDRQASSPAGRPLVVHNIGAGAQEEDVLFAWPQTGHYRWFAESGPSFR